MLPSTIAVTGFGSFTKISEDKQSGTLYTLDSSPRNYPTTLTVKHEMPAVGKSGVERHLLSLRKHYVDVNTGNATSDAFTVNFTAAFPNSGFFAEAELISAISGLLGVVTQAAANAAPISTAFDSSTDFARQWLNGHY